MNQHPNIYMGEEKEIFFFSHKFDKKSLDWYKKRYRNYEGEKAVGDGSNNIIVSKYAPKRISKYINDPKFIFIVRDPIDRLMSAYKLRLKQGKESVKYRTFSDFIRRMKNKKKSWPLKMGIYYKNISRYEEKFGEDKVKTIFFSDFKSETIEVVQSIYKFLGVRKEFKPKIEIKVKSGNRSSSRVLRFAYRYRDMAEEVFGFSLRSSVTSCIKDWIQRASGDRPKMTSEDWKFLVNYYKDDVEALQDHLGRDLSHWLTKDS